MTNGTCIWNKQKDVWVGPPVITNQKVDGGYYYAGIQICPGDHWLSVTPEGYGAGVATWTVPPGITYFVGTNTLDFTFPSSWSSVTISARSANSCGTGPNSYFYLSKKTWGCDGGYSMTLNPNPASDHVTVTITKNESAVENSDSVMTHIAMTPEETSVPINYTVRIFDNQSTLLSTMTRSGNSFDIPLTNMRDGTYVIEVSDGRDSISRILIVKHN